jgi:hypothetical protein
LLFFVSTGNKSGYILSDMILAEKLGKFRAKNELTMSEDSRLQGTALTVAVT